jgi:DNA-directed RNA polymerase subunit beta'
VSRLTRDGIIPALDCRDHPGSRALQRDAAAGLPVHRRPVDKKRLSLIVNDLAERYTKAQVAASLDALKETGFYWATRSGATVAISTSSRRPQDRDPRGLRDQAAKVQSSTKGSDHRR